MQRFLVLDSFRGLAAVSVALFHLQVSNPVTDSAFVDHSNLMVDFFFVLSGFIISHTYFYRWTSDFVGFTAARLARLYPLHIYTLLVFLLFECLKYILSSSGTMAFNSPAFGLNNGTTFVENVLMFDSFPLLGSEISWNYPSWSISAEFYSNVIIAASILTFSINSKIKFISLAIAIFAGVCLLLGVTNSDRLTPGTFGIVQCLYGFSLGMVAYAVHVEIAQRRIAGFMRHVAECVAMFALLCAVIYDSDVRGLYGPFVFAAAILVFAREEGCLSALLRWRPFVHVGEISYSIYLNHAIVAVIVQKLYARLFPEGDIPASLAVTLIYIAAVLAYSNLTYRMIEAPWRKRLRTLVARAAATAR